MTSCPNFGPKSKKVVKNPKNLKKISAAKLKILKIRKIEDRLRNSKKYHPLIFMASHRLSPRCDSKTRP